MPEQASNLLRTRRPRVGDTLWRVEWCSRLAFDEAGDVDRDNCTTSTRTFETHAAAREFAVATWPSTHETFGIVEVDPIEFMPYDDADALTMPHVGHWQAIGDAEIYSGEWE